MDEQTVQGVFAEATRVAAQFERLKEELRAQAAATNGGTHLASNFGYCARACEGVEDAIFNALNSLSSYLDNREAAELLRNGDGWQAAKRAARREGVAQ